MEISRTTLYGKLNSVAYKALEAATGLCRSKGHADVRIEHWLFQLLHIDDSDIPLILARLGRSPVAARQEVTAALERLPGGAPGIRDIHESIDLTVERAWVYSTLIQGVNSIRSGMVLAALIKTARLKTELTEISPTLAAISEDLLLESFAAATDGSREHELGPFSGAAPQTTSLPARRDIFISYRRSEAQHLAGRVYDHIERAFGAERVFKDVDAITVGTRDFALEIETQLRSARLLIALIGPSWLTVRDAAGRRRLDDRNDLVRLEIKWALDRRLPVLPLLFDDAVVPASSQLPAAFRALARCQAIPLRVDPDFKVDINRVIQACRLHLADGTIGTQAPPLRASGP